MRLAILALAALVTVVAHRANAAITAWDYVGGNGIVYSIVWDGHVGELDLRPLGRPSQLIAGGRSVGVRYMCPLDPQMRVEGVPGPGYLGTSSSLKHRIVFWVDFNNTPPDTSDDQRFDGYIMTQTKQNLAGVTWWQGIPFGFYAIYKYVIPK